MSRWYFTLAMIFPVGLIAQPAPPDHTIETWDGDHFTRYCGSYLDEPIGPEGALCRGFMLGFVAGALAVQESVSPNDDDETFADRATRTRAGSRVERLRLEALPWFCFSPDTTLAEIAESALGNLDAESAAGDPDVATALRRALARAMPCDAD